MGINVIPVGSKVKITKTNQIATVISNRITPKGCNYEDSEGLIELDIFCNGSKYCDEMDVTIVE